MPNLTNFSQRLPFRTNFNVSWKADAELKSAPNLDDPGDVWLLAVKPFKSLIVIADYVGVLSGAIHELFSNPQWFTLKFLFYAHSLFHEKSHHLKTPDIFGLCSEPGRSIQNNFLIVFLMLAHINQGWLAAMTYLLVLKCTSFEKVGKR